MRRSSEEGQWCGEGSGRDVSGVNLMGHEDGIKGCEGLGYEVGRKSMVFAFLFPIQKLTWLKLVHVSGNALH